MADAKILFRPREPFVDARGEILNLVDAPFESAAVIRSEAGAVRGNHYHKTDYHYTWLQSGLMEYYHRSAGTKGTAEHWTVRPGDIIYSPPGYEHTMVFPEPSVMFVFARNNREMANYEQDIVRVPDLRQ